MNRRPNGFGSLIFKGEGKPWLARWVFKGQVHYQTTGESDKKKALKKLEYITRPYREERAIDVERNLLNRIQTLQETASKTRLLIADIWTEFAKKLKRDDVESGTQATYEVSVGMMTEWMLKKAKYVKDITPKLAEEYLESLSESVGPSTYNTRLVLFKRIWRELGNEFQFCADAWENFKKKKVPKSSRRALTSKELGEVFSKAKTKDMRLLLAVGMYTGLRISDSALLKWSDIDFEKKTIKTIPIKTKKHMDAPIEIPIHPTLMKMIEDMPHDGQYISEENARVYKTGHLGKNVVDLFKDCGLETSKKVNGKTILLCSFHSLRHTFVSMSINGGMSPLLVQKLVGHSAVNMTEAYFHDNLEKMAEGISSLPDVVQFMKKN